MWCPEIELNVVASMPRRSNSRKEASMATLAEPVRGNENGHSDEQDKATTAAPIFVMSLTSGTKTKQIFKAQYKRSAHEQDSKTYSYNNASHAQKMIHASTET